MQTFSELVDAAGELTSDEQAELIAILQRRVVETNRQQILQDIAASRAEHLAGQAEMRTASQVIDEIRRES
jgi:hypothetical protein